MSRSEKKGLRRYLPFLSLFAVLLLAAAFVLLLPVIKKTFPADNAIAYTSTPTYQTVAEFDNATLETVTVTHADGESYTLVYQDGILSLKTDTGELEAISAILSENFIKYATTIYAEDTIAEDESEVEDQLSAMGFNPPQITTIAVFSDGSEITIELGDSLYDTSYYYYRWSGDHAIYLCNAGLYETFSYTADMLRTVTQPPISASLVERVSILHGDDDTIVCTFSSDENDTVQGTLQSPFVYPMDTEAAENLITAISNFRLGMRLMPVTDENRASYGLDVPQAVIKITQREGLYSEVTSEGAFLSYTLEATTITFKLGDIDGEFFYFCEYEGTCYRVSGFLVSAFLKADVRSYAALNPADLGDETIQNITVQTGTGALAIHAAYTENVLPNNELETDEYGNIVYTTEVTCNGEAITADAFDALTERLKAMAVSGELDNVQEPDGTPKWQIAITTSQGKTRTLAAYTMDAFSDVLAVDGYALFYISNEALDIALGEFSALLTQQDTE